MRTLSEEENSWASELALRLRTVQAEGSAVPLEQRREMLQKELTLSLANVPATQRQQFLEAALARFPVAGQLPTAANGPAQASEAPTSALPSGPPATPPPPAPPKSAEELLSDFLAAAGELPEEQRSAMARKLGEAGFTWVDREALVLEVGEEFRKGLGLSGDQQPLLTRMMQLSLLLIDLVHRLEHTGFKTLGELSPRSPLLGRPQDFREAVVHFLTGNSESIEPQMRGISSLLGGLMAAMLGAGRDFGRQFVERFAPGSIEDVIKGEGKLGLFGNEKALCWDKYKDLTKDYSTPELIDRRIKDCLGAFADKKVAPGR